MSTVAAPDQESKEPSGGKRSAWNAPGGGKKDPDLERICALTYLVVDDSRFARAIAKNVLHAIGIRNLFEVEDACQALAAIEKQEIDVAIVDFEMPGMSGAEFTWRLRRSKIERIQQMPIVMISNHADEGHILKAINSGVNEFLPKPFSQGGLYDRLRRAVVARRPFIVSEVYVGPDRRLKDRDFPRIQQRRGLPPVVLLDFTGPEPRRIEVGKDRAGIARFSAMAETEAPVPDQPAPDQPAGEAVADNADLIRRSVDEKLKD